MLPVFICEDNPVLLQQFRQTIENLILIEEYDIELLTAVTTPEELLHAAKQHYLKNAHAGFYLLDIDLHASMDGFELHSGSVNLIPAALLSLLPPILKWQCLHLNIK